MNESTPSPDQIVPAEDWLDQQGVAGILGVSEKTASEWAQAGRLKAYEHGFPNCGRRKYSRSLVLREIQRCWEEAARRQDANEEAS